MCQSASYSCAYRRIAAAAADGSRGRLRAVDGRQHLGPRLAPLRPSGLHRRGVSGCEEGVSGPYEMPHMKIQLCPGQT